MPHLQPKQNLADRFIIRRFLGASAVGEKYLAFDSLRNQVIGFKLISADIVSDSGGLNGIRSILNQLTHLAVPGIARVYDYGLLDEQLFLTMEYLNAIHYSEWLKQPRSESDLLSFFGTLAQQLHAAQSMGSHMGLKPNNLFVSDANSPLITDYGLNRLVSPEKLRTAAMLTGDRTFFPPEFFLDPPSYHTSVDAFGLGSLWLLALKDGKTTVRNLKTRTTKKWIPQLTHSNAKLRTTNFGRLAKELHGNNSLIIPLTQPRDSAHKPTIGTILSVCLLIGLIAIGSWWYTTQQNQPSRDQAVDRTEIAVQLQSAEHQRMDLIENAHKQPKTFPLFMPLLKDPVLMDIARNLAGTNVDQQDTFQELQQAVFRYQHHLATVGELLRQVAAVAEKIAIVEKVSQSSVPLPKKRIEDWEDSYQSIQKQLERQELEAVLQNALALSQDISVALDAHWETAYQSTRMAQSGWAESLDQRGLKLVEPGEDLSGEFQKLLSRPVYETLPEDLSELHRLKEKWEAWTNEHNAVPPPTPDQFVNTLDMRFVPVGNLLVSIWETRHMDFARHIQETGLERLFYWREYAYHFGPTHPVSNVGQLAATVFCEWLTESERRQNRIGPSDTYRLPSDKEWSSMAGSPNQSNANPLILAASPTNHFPWFPKEAPPKRRGNYFTWPNEAPPPDGSEGYDIFPRTAPVGWFSPNPYGIYDLGGNVWEWTSTISDPDQDLSSHHVHFVIRGAGWRTSADFMKKTHYRRAILGNHHAVGFRIVLDTATQSSRETE